MSPATRSATPDTIPSIRIEPISAPIDVPRAIHLTGFAPGVDVTLVATLRDNLGEAWRSHARFRTDSTGEVDLARATPQSGTWQSPSPMAVVWSMQPDPAQNGPAAGPVDPLTVWLTVDGPGGQAKASFEQIFVAPGVSRTELRDDGFVGTLFTPAGEGPHPVVVVLAGSGGGLMEARAALYAEHGYAALALGYFGAPGLPERISGTRLEYFEAALAWVHRVLTPANGFVALSGVSRGGELSLLLASSFPQAISAVVAYVPSPFTHGVLNAGGPGEDRHSPAWLWHDKPLPVLSRDNTRARWALFDEAAPPRRQTPAFLTALEDAQASARAMIPLERIAGPVLLISGADDALWPSARFSEIAAEHLTHLHHPYVVRHLDYPGAGHSIGYPYVPTTVVSKPHAVSGIDLAYGGTAEGNARAGEESWRAVLQFLAEAVRDARARRTAA
jgi:dienelactone hydrolase